MKYILSWYVGLVTRVLGFIWDVAAGWRCTSCGWRNPNYAFACQECSSQRL